MEETTSEPNNALPPPLPLPLPPSTSNRHRTTSFPSSPSFRGCCCCLCLLFSLLALLAVTAALLVLLALRPKRPQFALQTVRVQYMGVTAPSLFSAGAAAATPNAAAALPLDVRLVFTAVNPNRVGIQYRESRFTVMYRGIPLGRGRVGGFYQEAHSEREVEAVVGVERVNLEQADAAELIRDAALNDRVELRVLGDVGAKIRVLDVDSPGVQVSVDCSIVISPRNQSLTYKQCGFDGLSL